MDRINGVVAKTEPVVEEEADERKRTYNNAFNPALNRKSKKYEYWADTKPFMYKIRKFKKILFFHFFRN